MSPVPQVTAAASLQVLHVDLSPSLEGSQECHAAFKRKQRPPPQKQGARSYRKPGRGASTLVPQPKSPGPCAARPDSCWLVKVEDGHRSGLSRAELSLNALFPLPRGMSEVLKGTWQNRPPPPKPLLWYLWRSGPAKASLGTAVLHGEWGGGGSDEALPGFLTNYTEKFK